MTDLEDYTNSWENDEVQVEILFSAAGVGTTIALLSKFTGKIMLLDVGDGAIRDLLLFQNNHEFVNEIDLVAISHGHFDHVGGLYSLLGFMRMLGRTKPLNIIIPPNCKEVIELVRLYKDLHCDTLPFKIWHHEISPGSDFDTDFFKVRSFEVEHYSLEYSSDEDEEVLEPAHGYRIQIGGTTIAYTGDTRMCSGAENLVKDADLAIIEATHPKQPDSKRRVHLTIDEAKDLGRLAKAYLLIHMIPEVK